MANTIESVNIDNSGNTNFITIAAAYNDPAASKKIFTTIVIAEK